MHADPPTASLRSVRTLTLQDLGLDHIASSPSDPCYYNLSYGELADHQAQNREGIFTETGAFAVDTGKFTGRSPKAKYIVQDESTADIWWGEINQPMKPEVFDDLYDKVTRYYQNEVEHIYVQDLYCGAHKGSRRSVRFVTEKAWHSHFVKNMFIRPKLEELEGFSPDFTILNAYGLTDEDWVKHGLNSQVFVVFNPEKKIALVGGAWYGGEMKKGIFSMMHYWLPKEHCLSMHCSANIGADRGDTCLFFGLSGTGKTTLSTDPHRKLIGDDEHGWDDEGIFNFEGGCYAKTSKLTHETEPEIYDAIKANALLENVWIDPATRECDYFNQTMTENGRVSYPITHIQNREDSLTGGHPEYIVFLCCDAFGVLPPVAKLTPGQAMYHFVSGYTAKVAGTEIGVKEPEATFSPCYGAAFLTLHPMEYAKLMKEKLETHKVDCYLVNTGWSGGPYAPPAGTKVERGSRMSIKATRACLDAIFDGSIKKSSFKKDPLFHFEVPEHLEGVPTELLNPRQTWSDPAVFDKQYEALAKRFADNIDKYADGDLAQYEGCGPINKN